ncbi:BppU family phage baseplate upper protein, partial [Enterococcus faecalis]
MSKWQATLSTTEPYNYVGIINARQGNKNTETL